jgi:hypothetical protein
LECGESEDNQNIRFEENKVRQKMGVLREREKVEVVEAALLVLTLLD